MLSNMAIIICAVSSLIGLAMAAPAPLPQRSLITLTDSTTQPEPTQTTLGTIMGNKIVMIYSTTAESEAPPERVYATSSSGFGVLVVPNSGHRKNATGPATSTTTSTTTTTITTTPAATTWDPSAIMPLVEGPGPVNATLAAPSVDENGHLEKRATLTTFHVPTRAPGHGADYMPPKMKREVVEEPEEEKEEEKAYWNRIIDWAGVQ